LEWCRGKNLPTILPDRVGVPSGCGSHALYQGTSPPDLIPLRVHTTLPVRLEEKLRSNIEGGEKESYKEEQGKEHRCWPVE
jgi:hypothetical protein